MLKTLDVMKKYEMSIADVFHVRAFYGGTVLVGDVGVANEPPPTDWPRPTRCTVRFPSLDDADYNRAMTLFFALSPAELTTILGRVE